VGGKNERNIQLSLGERVEQARGKGKIADEEREAEEGGNLRAGKSL